MLFGHDEGKNIIQLCNGLKDLICVKMGGTGKESHTANAVLTGNGTDAVKNVATANGAFYATAANGAPKFGTLPIAQGGTGKTTALEALLALGGIQIKKLWENASPTSAFAAQSFSFDSAGYVDFLVKYYDTKDKAYLFATFAYKDCYFRMETSTNLTNDGYNMGRATRWGKITEGNLQFSDCILKGFHASDVSGTYNDYVIPYQIFGIKGVL